MSAYMWECSRSKDDKNKNGNWTVYSVLYDRSNKEKLAGKSIDMIWYE